MATIECTYDEFKGMSRDLWLALPTLDAEQLESGAKCLALAYLGIQWGDSPLDTVHRELEAPTVLRIIMGKVIEREVELAMEGAGYA